VPHVVEALHELVEPFEGGKAAGQIEKCLFFEVPGNHEVPVRQLGDLVPIGAAKKVQRRKGELRDAVWEQIEPWIELIPCAELQGREFRICGNVHGCMILGPSVLDKNPEATLAQRHLSVS
jgi:hypothetical protein